MCNCDPKSQPLASYRETRSIVMSPPGSGQHKPLPLLHVTCTNRLLFFHSLFPQISPVLEPLFPKSEKTTTIPEPQNPHVSEQLIENLKTISEQVPQHPLVSEHVPDNEDQMSYTDTEKYNYFSGEMVPNPLGPV